MFINLMEELAGQNFLYKNLEGGRNMGAIAKAAVIKNRRDKKDEKKE